MTPARFWSVVLLAFGLGPAAAQVTQAPPAPQTATLAALQARADAHLLAGLDHPDAALAALRQLAAVHPGRVEQHTLLVVRGLVAAASGRAAEVQAAASALQAQASPLAIVDASLVRASLALSQGLAGESTQAARTALQRYAQLCPQDAACNWRSRWQALQMLARQGASIGHTHDGREHALAAAELARTRGDTARQIWALGTAAELSSALGDIGAEQRYLARAQRLARMDGTLMSLTRVKMHEMLLHQHHGEWEPARRSALQGLALARQAQSPRMESYLLANLSDIEVKSGHPRHALQVTDRALPVLRRLGDRRIEQVVLHNAALARIALGQGESARRTLDELLAAHAAAGATGNQAVVLREFADAFAHAGDHASALALYHRERKVAADLMATNRDAALAALRSRYDREAQQRRLEQLARENALISTQIENRKVMQTVWLAGAAVLLLATGLVALLYRRVREINRHLAHNHAFLRAQTRRDPLTGLANRRALHDAAQAQRAEQRFDGALLLVDIDHFKHVNDGHGHASGDIVLVEVARRLAGAVAERDLVVRWGGEEFLIFMPGAGLAQAQALAVRLLHGVAGEPVQLPGGPLRVTVSVGYGRFPLPAARLPLSLERAINLSDMALYLAKGRGRNRAVGVAALTAVDDAQLRLVEADFDQAWQEGRVSLVVHEGPAEPVRLADEVAAAAA